MVTVSTGQALPFINMALTSGQVYFNTGSRGGRFQRGGRGYRGRFNRALLNTQLFLMLIVWIVHHLIFLKIN